MKKSFPLEIPGRKPARVIDAIKHDVRKYVKRERRKELPEGVDFCDFDCRVGRDAETASPVHLAEINKGIDAAEQENWPEVYIEILAKPGYRRPRPSATEEPEKKEASEETDSPE